MLDLATTAQSLVFLALRKALFTGTPDSISTGVATAAPVMGCNQDVVIDAAL
jgi:hypothetical protein